MATTLLLLQQLSRSARRRRSELSERETLANTPLCSEESVCIEKCRCCRRFTCTGLVLALMGFITTVLLIVSLVSTVITRYTKFNASTLSFSPGDSKEIKDGFSYTFCKSVVLSNVVPDTSRFDAYLLGTDHRLSSSMTDRFYQRESVLLTPNTWYHWKAHLLAGSKVTVEISLGQYPCEKVSFYVTTGHADFDSLLSGNSCQCIVAKDSPCKTAVEINARTNDDYYFAVASKFDISVSLLVNVTWERRVYQTKDIDDECHSAKCFEDVCYHGDCFLIVPEATALVVTVPANANYSLTDVIDIDMVCDPQVIAYVIMFATLPLVGFAVILPLGFIIIHVARRIEPRKSRRRRRAGSTNVDAMVCREVPLSEMPPIEIRLCPPPYDGHGPPPPYERSSSQSQHNDSVHVETHLSAAGQSAEPVEPPAAPPSYDESSRDFVVALATPL